MTQEIIQSLNLTESGNFIKDLPIYNYKTIDGIKLFITECDIYGNPLEDKILIYGIKNKSYAHILLTNEMAMDPPFVDAYIKDRLIKKLS